jgi:dipeptidyl aminopeptidase/acylaminoacyl peptidase
VPVGQSILEQSALEAAHKDVQFVQIDGDDHYMRQEATRIRVLQETEKFLKAHIGS